MNQCEVLKILLTMSRHLKSLEEEGKVFTLIFMGPTYRVFGMAGMEKQYQEA